MYKYEGCAADFILATNSNISLWIENILIAFFQIICSPLPIFMACVMDSGSCEHPLVKATNVKSLIVQPLWLIHNSKNWVEKHSTFS